MKLRTYLLLIAAGLLSQFVNAQYTIHGKVFSVENKEALPFVSVVIKGTTVGAQTDFDGNYVIKTATLGDSLMAAYVGYKRMARPLKKDIMDQEINFPMSEQGVALE